MTACRGSDSPAPFARVSFIAAPRGERSAIALCPVCQDMVMLYYDVDGVAAYMEHPEAAGIVHLTPKRTPQSAPPFSVDWQAAMATMEARIAGNLRFVIETERDYVSPDRHELAQVGLRYALKLINEANPRPANWALSIDRWLRQEPQTSTTLWNTIRLIGALEVIAKQQEGTDHDDAF